MAASRTRAVSSVIFGASEGGIAGSCGMDVAYVAGISGREAEELG